MLTKEKVQIYRRYEGDIDRWARNGSLKEKYVMNDHEWYTIDSLLQDLYLAKKGLASIEFEDKLNNKLRENCSDQDTIEQLKNLAK